MSDSRLFKILYYLLDKGGTTASELAEEFEVSTRTIYRDIEALSGAGIPVYTEQGRNGGIYLLPSYTLNKALLSEEERREVLTAIQSMSATGYHSGEETLTKLSALFHVNMGDWLEVDFSRWGKSTSDNTKFETLKQAVIQHREVKITYENTSGERMERIVQPLKLSYKSKEWYLKAFCLERQDFRLFKLNRIMQLELSEQIFVPRPYPQQNDDSQQSDQRIVLLFSKEMAYRVYDEFDETQIEHQPNGDMIVSAKMPVNAWLIGYLLSFGTQVEIMEPEYLKEILAAQVEELCKKLCLKNEK